MELKVGDFGLATKLEFEGDRKRTICGTPNYIAPEILDGKQGHSYEVDIWSFGVIVYTLLIGKPPFETNDVKSTYKRIKMNAYTFPEGTTVSDGAKDLITKILNLDPTKRPNLDEIYNNSFFRSGNTIPKLLPPSTLACPPSASYVKQFSTTTPTAEVYVFENKTQIESPNITKEIIPTIIFPDKVHENIELKEPPGKPVEIPSSSNPSPMVWVTKWVDYSTKYGLGYLLSNNSCGVFFNDSTKIVLDPDGL